MDNLCPTCDLFTTEYLLNGAWKDELRDVLCTAENIHHLYSAENMSELELLALFIELRTQNKQHEKT